VQKRRSEFDEWVELALELGSFRVSADSELAVTCVGFSATRLAGRKEGYHGFPIRETDTVALDLDQIAISAYPGS